MTIWQYILLFGGVVAGGWVAMLFSPRSRTALSLLLSFSGAYVLGITMLHLMPDIFSSGDRRTGIYILAGFFLQLMLEQFSKGVEHGHIHPSSQVNTRFAIQIMIGLCLHAFIEGFPLSGYDAFHHHQHGIGDSAHTHFFYAILLHKIPAAFAMTTVLILSGFSRYIVWLCLIIFAIMSPLGALTGSAFTLSPRHFSMVLAVVVGTFLHIATTILFETDASYHHHKIPWKRLGAIIIGTLFAILTIV